MHFGKEISMLKEALGSNLPGTEVQWEMASSDRRIRNYPRNPQADSGKAAVLLLLYPCKGSLSIVFIQRPVYRGVHSGQISFPGGKKEKDDGNPEETALREACEETDVCDKEIILLGRLTNLFIPVSNTEVTPVVAYIDKHPDFYPDKKEVVSIIEAPLEVFINGNIVKEKPMRIRDDMLDVKYYDFNGHVIWGATAMILHELITVISKKGIL